MSQPLNGPISNRLRRIFKPRAKAWTPKRRGESTPMPKTGVTGIGLSSGRRKKK